jgi:hypothetical protein
VKFLLSLAFCGDLLPRSSVTCLIALQVSGSIPRLGRSAGAAFWSFVYNFLVDSGMSKRGA